MNTAFLKALGTIVLAALVIWMLIGTLSDAKDATVDLATRAGQGYCAEFGGLCE